MENSKTFHEREDRLNYAVMMLTTLRNMLAGAGSPLLMYFLDLASAQARHECSAGRRRPSREIIPLGHMRTH
ncbi:MAG: hypothetical protein ACLPGW_17785 [Roseiarcus sp.]